MEEGLTVDICAPGCRAPKARFVCTIEDECVSCPEGVVSEHRHEEWALISTPPVCKQHGHGTMTQL